MNNEYRRNDSSYSFYFAGELFSHKHVLGNAMLAAEIQKESEGTYQPILPQDLEFRSNDPRDIRDQDLLSLLQCDLALFQFDGAELDSGTVVEFMFAKFADIPSVILRTDFRSAGDQGADRDPWNLMCSYYPRTEVLVKSALEYAADAGHVKQTIESFSQESFLNNVRAQQEALRLIAKDVCAAFDSVLQEAPILASEQIESIYHYLTKIPNFGASEEHLKAIIEQVIERKRRLK